MTGPSVLPSVDDETLATAFRRVRREWATPAEVSVIDPVKLNAIVRKGHLHGNGLFHGPIVDPCARHVAELLSGLPSAI